jgi:hypothetical protein
MVRGIRGLTPSTGAAVPDPKGLADLDPALEASTALAL